MIRRGLPVSGRPDPIHLPVHRWTAPRPDGMRLVRLRLHENPDVFVDYAPGRRIRRSRRTGLRIGAGS